VRVRRHRARVGSISLLGSPLVVSGSPTEGEQVQAQGMAVLASPEAVSSQAVSETAYEGLSVGGAEKLDGERFPGLIEDPAGGVPVLPEGQRVTGIVDAYAVQADLGGEYGGLIESREPMAIESSPGQWSAIDLHPRAATGGGFEAVNPLVGVQVSRRLSEGILLADGGLSVTPLDEHGLPVGAEGVLDKSSVLFANALVDTDTVVKPSTLGFLVDTLLRSKKSPGQLSFRVGLPAGASLAAATDGSAQVVREGVVLASVPSPVARDARGVAVPVAMSVSGDVLTLTVARSPGKLEYPVAVDPEFNIGSDSTLSSKTWEFSSPTGGFTSKEYCCVKLKIEPGTPTQGQWGELYYRTKGTSKLYKVAATDEFPTYGSETELFLQGESELYLEFESSAGREGRFTIAEHNVRIGPKATSPELCASAECSPANGGEHNLVRLGDVATGNGGAAGVTLTSATVSIGQPKETHSTVTYNTSNAEIDHTSNVLQTGGWVGPNSGAIEFTANDLGIGIANTQLEWYEASKWNSVGNEKGTKKYLGTGSCVGVQCAASQSEALNYANLVGVVNATDGERTIRVAADDAIEHTWSSEHGEGEVVLKFDKTPPHGLTLSGLASKGGELELGEVEAHVKAEAIDGEGTVPSSGVKSIALGVDGREIGKAAGSCPRGLCTASGEWSINGADLGVGMHTLTVVATDNASNVETKNYTLIVYHASPVALGPGSVNPESGDFALGATDVNVSGGAGSLAVTRHYDSRNLKEGEEGPLGPQWTVSLGSLASLEVLPDGSAMLVGPEGLTHFSVKTGGGFEAPKGDTNLTLEAVKNSKEEITEYVVKNPAKGTTTRFTLPSGAKSWMPTVSEGPVATNTTTDTYQTASGVEEYPVPYLRPTNTEPAGIAVGSDGNLWFTGNESHKIGRMLPSGVVTGEYSVPTSSLGPIVGGPDGNLWYVNAEHRKLGKITTSGIESEYSSPGYGSQYGIAAGPDGDIWYTVAGSHEVTGTIGKMTTSGTVTGEYTGTAKLKPTAIAAGPDGNMWFVNSKCSSFGEACTVGKIATSGSVLAEYAVKGVPNAIVTGPNHEKAVWVTTPANNTVQRITTSGAVSEYLLPTNSGPEGIAAGPDGNLWFTDSGTSKVSRITPGGTISEYTLHSEASTPSAIAAGPDGRLWFTESNISQIGAIVPSGVVVEPKLELAPHASASCPASEPEKWEKGCRGLEFVYDNESRHWLDFSKELGGNENEWGEYNGRLGEVKFIAYDPPEKRIATKVVAKYEYDMLGRLRAVWNPEISPALKTVYGYDPEGHLTALTPARGESQTFTYGTIAGDASRGRLVKATRAPVTAKLWGGEPPKDTEAPKLSGTPVTGVTMGISNGAWSNEPVSYAYQWEDCSSTGTECTPILGATNADYTVASGDVGHTLIVRETATNGGGSVAAFSAPSAVVASTGTKTEGTKYSPGAGTTIEYQIPLSGTGLPSMSASEVAKWGQKDDPVYGAAVFPPDEPQGWPATDYRRATISYFDGQARTTNIASPSGGISTTEYNSEGNVAWTLSVDNRATAMKETNTVEAAERLDTKNAYNSEGQLTDTWGPQHTVKLAVGKTKPDEEALARNHIKYFYDEGAPEGETHDLVTKTIDGAETSNKEEFERRTATTSYSGQNNLGWKLRAPTSVTTDPGGLNLTSTTKYEESTGNVIETQSPAASGGDASVAPAYAAQFGKAGSEPGQLKEPKATAITSAGNVDVLDSGNSRVEEFSASGTYLGTFGSVGTGNGNLKTPYAMVEDSKGNVWVADTANNRVQEFNSKSEYVAQFGKEGTAEAQFKEPKGISVAANGNIFVSDTANNRVEEFNEKDEFKAAFGYGVSNGEAKLEVCTSSCRAGIAGSGNGQFNTPRGIAVSATGNVWVADSGNTRIEEFKENGEYVTAVGTNGTGNGQFTQPSGIAIDAAGKLWAADGSSNRIQEFTSSGAYVTTIGVKGTGNGQLEEPWGMAFTSTGNMYAADAKNSRVERWVPTITGNTSARDTKTIYYTAKAEGEVVVCREHPEWTGLPCQTTPVAQPGVSGLPSLPVTTITYNMWDQAEKTEEAFGSVIRTRKTTYDSAGRPQTSEETSTLNTVLPKVTDKYNTTSGALEEQSTTVGETTKKVVSKYNTLGQLETYTDADGNVATFEYEKEGDARVTKMTDPKGNQSYVYDKTTGALKELVDSAAGTFTASYDVGGRMTSESYPNGMTAYYTYNPVGGVTMLEYKKLTHCTEKCTWFASTKVPSIHGETLSQSSTFAEQPSYSYDAAGRLTQVQETPAGEGCKTRLYAYEENGNRTTETTREPGSEGKCASEGGSTEWHTYDTAGTLADPGVAYDEFGNTTALPAADAGGSVLKSEYYVDGQVYKQEQNGEKIEYKLDPEDRTRETVSSGTTSSTVVSHYDGSGGALGWTSEEEGKKWTRNIPGIDGTLTATQASTGTITLLLHDLQGNVVATVGNSETETKLLTKYNSTEFGVPNSKEAPPKYAWLGAAGIAGELPSGVITQDGITYVPQTGQPLQTEGVPLAAISNTPTPFSRPVEAWVGSRAGEGAAIGVAKARQREEEQAIANQPPGVIPSGNPGSWCGGEYGPCEGEEEGGGGEGGCSGMNACAASSTYCERHWRFGEPIGGVLWVAAGVKCNRKVSGIEVEACLWVWNGKGSTGDNKNYSNLVCSGSNEKGDVVHNASEAATLAHEVCGEAWSYKAWVWGRAWGPHFWFVGRGLVSPTWVCKDAPYGFEAEYTELFLSK
jgi:YD repeat-containing protein